MNAKFKRIKKIKDFLKSQSVSSTITEIHKTLKNRFGLDISRKTIERDIDELVEERIVLFLPGLPTRYKIIPQNEIELNLTKEEIRTIISNLGESTEISMKLKRYLN